MPRGQSSFFGIYINAPPEFVFDYLADARNMGEWSPGTDKVELASTGAIGLGTRFRLCWERGVGKGSFHEVVISEHQRPSHLVFVFQDEYFEDITEEFSLKLLEGGTLLERRVSTPMNLTHALLARSLDRAVGQSALRELSACAQTDCGGKSTAGQARFALGGAPGSPAEGRIQGGQERLKSLGSMADLVLLLQPELRQRSVCPVDSENRVVAEPGCPPRNRDDLARARPLCDHGLPTRLHKRNHALESGRPRPREGTQQLQKVLPSTLIVGMGPRVARRANPGLPPEEIHLQPAVVCEGEQTRGRSEGECLLGGVFRVILSILLHHQVQTEPVRTAKACGEAREQTPIFAQFSRIGRCNQKISLHGAPANVHRFCQQEWKWRFVTNAREGLEGPRSLFLTNRSLLSVIECAPPPSCRQQRPGDQIVPN